MSQYAAPAALLLTLVAVFSGPDLGGFAVAALVCWVLALAFE